MIFYYFPQSEFIFSRFLELSLIEKIWFNFKIRFFIERCIIDRLSHLSSLEFLMVGWDYFRLVNNWMFLWVFSDCRNHFIILIITIRKHTFHFFFSLMVLACYWSFIYWVNVLNEYYFLFVLALLANFLWWNPWELHWLTALLVSSYFNIHLISYLVY